MPEFAELQSQIESLKAELAEAQGAAQAATGQAAETATDARAARVSAALAAAGVTRPELGAIMVDPDVADADLPTVCRRLARQYPEICAEISSITPTTGRVTMPAGAPDSFTNLMFDPKTGKPTPSRASEFRAKHPAAFALLREQWRADASREGGGGGLVHGGTIGGARSKNMATGDVV